MNDKKRHILPLIMTVVMFIVLFLLGTWQVYRYKYKISLQSEVGTSLSIAPEIISCGKLAQIANKGHLHYRRFIIKNAKTVGRNIFVFAGSRAIRGEAGYFVVSELRCQNHKFIINMGWIPASSKGKFLNKHWNLKNLRVTLMPNEIKRIFTPENDKKANVWFYINSADISSYFGFNNPGFYLQRAFYDNNYPVGKDPTKKIRNDHLGYAITWYSLAVVNLVVYLIYSRRNKGIA